MSAVLYCPRCREELTADHECAGLTRRVFFGLFAGASAAMAFPCAWGTPEVLLYQWARVGIGDLIYRAAHQSFVFQMPGSPPPPPITVMRAEVQECMLQPSGIWNGYPDSSILIVRNPARPFWMRR